MQVSDQKVVSLSYDLKVGDNSGELVEQVTSDAPLTFLYGAGNLLETFENNVKELSEGDDFQFTIKSEEAYGPYKEDAIVDLPYDVFRVDGELREDLLKVGTRIPMKDSEGNPLEGKIIELKDDAVRMDFNHPLAGEDLHFEGKIEKIREASDQEKEEGVAKEGESQ